MRVCVKEIFCRRLHFNWCNRFVYCAITVSQLNWAVTVVDPARCACQNGATSWRPVSIRSWPLMMMIGTTSGELPWPVTCTSVPPLVWVLSPGCMEVCCRCDRESLWAVFYELPVTTLNRLVLPKMSSMFWNKLESSAKKNSTVQILYLCSNLKILFHSFSNFTAVFGGSVISEYHTHLKHNSRLDWITFCLNMPQLACRLVQKYSLPFGSMYNAHP